MIKRILLVTKYLFYIILAISTFAIIGFTVGYILPDTNSYRINGIYHGNPWKALVDRVFFLVLIALTNSLYLSMLTDKHASIIPKLFRIANLIQIPIMVLTSISPVSTHEDTAFGITLTWALTTTIVILLCSFNKECNAHQLLSELWQRYKNYLIKIPQFKIERISYQIIIIVRSLIAYINLGNPELKLNPIINVERAIVMTIASNIFLALIRTGIKNSLLWFKYRTIQNHYSIWSKRDQAIQRILHNEEN